MSRVAASGYGCENKPGRGSGSGLTRLREALASPRRYAAMDGYRGLFVLLVIAYHYGVTSLVGGWVGINHFFVFSGFLIARILIKERQQTGRIDVVRFYARRARRVLPAMFLLVAAVLVHTAITAPAQQIRQIGGDCFATLFFFLNWRLISRDDAYFDQVGNPSPLRHAWTLSVEEQFYLLVPFLILAVVALTKSRVTRAGIMLALACVSAWWTAHIGYHSFEDQARLYYGTDTRVQALLVGVAFGFLFGLGSDGRGPVLPSRALTQTLGIIGTVISVSAVFLLSENSDWVYNDGGMLLFALGASLMGWSSIDPRGLLINKVFGWAPLAFIGRISYGLYLYHWPILLWVHIPGVPKIAMGIIQFALTLAVSVASFIFIEAPIMQSGLRGILPRMSWGRRRLVAGGIAGVLVAGALVSWRTPVDGLPSNVPPLVAGTHAYHPQSRNHPFALVGDSVGSSLARGFDSGLYSDLPMGDDTAIGCDLEPYPIMHNGSANAQTGACQTWRNNLTTAMKKQHAEVMVIMGDAHFLTAHQVGGQTVTPRTSAGADAIKASLDDLARRAKAAGVHHVIVVTIPLRRISADKLAAPLRFFAAQGSNDASVRWANDVITSWVQDHSGSQKADVTSKLAPKGYQPVLNGVSLYEDTLHFTSGAAEMIWSWLAPMVRSAATSVSH